MFTSPAIDMIGKGLLSAGHLGAWTSRVRGLPEFGGELPVAALTEEITTPGAGQIRALLTMAGNPVSSTPAGHRLADALGELEFMASLDFYINETTRHADVILPPTGPLERDHYDLVFHMFAVRNTARWSSALFEFSRCARPNPVRRSRAWLTSSRICPGWRRHTPASARALKPKSTCCCALPATV